MKHWLFAFVLTAAATPVLADVGVSINIGEPTFFGRIDIGNAPPPRVIYSRPVVIERVRVEEDPVYLRVPIAESRDWRRYCGRYDACGRPVYFVQDRWYRNVYVPHYRGHREEYERSYPHDHGYDRHEDRGNHGHKGGREERREDRREEQYDDRRDHDDREHNEDDDHRNDHHR